MATTDLGTFNERDTPVYYGLVEDDIGDVVDMTAVDSLTLTVWDEITGTPLNGRAEQDVKNANGVTCYATAQTATIKGVTVTYNIKWPLVEAEMVIVNDAHVREQRHATFIAKWSSSTKRKTEDVVWTVENLRKVA